MAAFGTGIKKELWVSIRGERIMRTRAKKALSAYKIAQKKLAQEKKAYEKWQSAENRKKERASLTKKKAAELAKRRAAYKSGLKKGKGRAGTYKGIEPKTRAFRRVSKFWEDAPTAYQVRLDGRKAPIRVSGGTISDAVDMAITIARKLYPKRKGKRGAVHLDGGTKPLTY